MKWTRGPENKNNRTIIVMVNASKIEVWHIYSGRILNASKVEAQRLKLIFVTWGSYSSERMHIRYLGENEYIPGT